MLRAVLAGLALLCGPFALASESRVSGADMAEIRAVINRQIDAFRRDDARGAFELASPKVQQAFGTPEKFMDTVRAAYRPVYRPAAFSFLDVMVVSGDVVQQIQVTDRAGGVWLAYYSMQRQPDGSWRANGCHLAPPARTISA